MSDNQFYITGKASYRWSKYSLLTKHLVFKSIYFAFIGPTAVVFIQGMTLIS
jgi:hypothetical protein